MTMKILYGIQGTGNGHISRARMMAKYFSETDVQVDYLFSGRPRGEYFDMEVFGDYQCRRGLTFDVQHGSVSYWGTWYKNSVARFMVDVIGLDVDSYDLIISDYEPVTAWAGKLRNKMVMGIGHQYAFGENTPLSGDNFFTRRLMKNFAPVEVPIGLHWSPYNKQTLPPIINTQLTREASVGKVLVYLPFEDQLRVTKLLNQFPQYSFIQYAPGLADDEIYNVSVRAPCHDGFKQDLCRAEAVICNAGFELVSECLFLGLPLLVKPLTGQMEQLSNASALKALSYAEVMNVVNYSSVSAWLRDNYKKASIEPLAIPDVAKALVDWIVRGNWHDASELQETLWRPLNKSVATSGRHPTVQSRYCY